MTHEEAERAAALATLAQRSTVDRGLQIANAIEAHGTQDWKELQAARELVAELRAMLRAARVSFPLPDRFAAFGDVVRQVNVQRAALAGVHREIGLLSGLLSDEALAARPDGTPAPRARETATNVRTGMEMLRHIVDLCQLLFPELAAKAEGVNNAAP